MSYFRRRDVAAVVFPLLLLLAAGLDEALADTAGKVIPLPDADRAQLEQYLGKGVVGDAIAASVLAAPETYLPHQGVTMTYSVMEVGKDPSTEAHKVENTADPSFSPGWHYTVGQRGSAYFQKSSDGNLMIVGDQDLDNKVLTRFTPGEPLLIAGLAPGESRTFSVKVAVADLSDPTDINHTGSLDITYTYIGAYSVTVPAGTYSAALIKWDYKGSVGPASIKETEYRFIAPSAGMIAMIETRHISAMLIYSDKTKLGKLLQSSN